MAEPAERQRTALRAPRVEFDLSALALGACGWLAYQWSWPALASVLQVPEVHHVPPWQGLRAEFYFRILSWLRLPFSERFLDLVGWSPVFVKEGDKQVAYALDLEVWKLAVVAAWLLVLWSVVAGAISRVYAVRIARDESIGVGDAVAFSFSNLKAFLLAPLFVATWAALFVGAAALAGAVAAVPTAGPFLQIVLHPLALVAALVALVTTAGAAFGLPVMTAAVAAERNGALDAVSRAYSYVFSRPVAYVAAAGITTVVAGVVYQFGAAFIGLATRAMAFGASWNADPSATIDAPRAIAGGGDLAFRADAVLGWPHPEKIEGLPLVWIYVAWAVSTLAVVAVSGYVLSYFVGGLTDTYFFLRREVDGIDESEVYMEGEEASLGEPLPGEPKPPAAGDTA